MRIVGGELKGRRLESPQGRDIRPTSDRAREALFNLLMHGPYDGPDGPAPKGLYVLDVFAGSGALGLEALSRGARRATFIEKDREAARLIRRNAEALGLEERIELLQRDASLPGHAARPHDLAFLDPPYGSGIGGAALSALAESGWLAPGAICLLEIGKAETLSPPADFRELDVRRYGAACVHVLRYAHSP